MNSLPTDGTHHVDLTPLESGRYQLLEVIGTGGMATVYRAWDERLQVTRAVKILLPQLARNTTIRHRFETEARTMARLYHPNIVGVHDVGVDDDRVYIVMELVAGGSLMDHVTANGPMPVKMATEALLALMHALKAAHSKGVIHRDIKPHNVMVDHTGVLKVCDFGIAHVADENMSMTKTGSVMGTWGYMAPEQRTSARDVDVRSDLYSAAATWFTLMTNLLPSDLFAVDLDESMFEGLPEEAQALMRSATRYKPEDRFDDAEAMILEVEKLLASLPDDPEDYPKPGANLTDEALKIGRRGATIVPHSESSEGVSGGLSAPTFAGGVISESLSKSDEQKPGRLPSATLFDGQAEDAPDESPVENTETRVARKNRKVFFAVLVSTLAVGAVVILQPGSESKDASMGPEELERERLLAEMYDVQEASDLELMGGSSEEGTEAEPQEEPEPLDEAVAEPAEEAAPTAAEAPASAASTPESEEVTAEPEEPDEAESAEGLSRIQNLRAALPKQLTYLSSVPVRGQVRKLETCYLLSTETGQRYQRPFARIPGGTYSLHYRFIDDEAGPVLQAAELIQVDEGSAPRIRCNANFGTCIVEN